VVAAATRRNSINPTMINVVRRASCADAGSIMMLSAGKRGLAVYRAPMLRGAQAVSPFARP